MGTGSGIRENMINTLDDMEAVAKLFEIEPFDIYFIGGAACALGEYTDNATRDFDFIDMNYSSNMGRIFAILRDYDMLEYESTVLSPDYKSRAKKIGNYKSFSAYVLSPEDIIVSKIIRLEEKDVRDIDQMMDQCDKSLINEIIDRALNRIDLFESKKQAVINNLPKFRERYCV